MHVYVYYMHSCMLHVCAQEAADRGRRNTARALMYYERSCKYRCIIRIHVCLMCVQQGLLIEGTQRSACNYLYYALLCMYRCITCIHVCFMCVQQGLLIESDVAQRLQFRASLTSEVGGGTATYQQHLADVSICVYTYVHSTDVYIPCAHLIAS